MDKKKRKRIFDGIINWLLILMLIGGVVCVFLFHEYIYANPSEEEIALGAIPAWFYTNPTGNALLDQVISYIPALITTVIAIFVAYVLNRVIFFITDATFRKATSKVKTVMTLLRSLIRWVIYIGAIFISLIAFGVDVVTLLVGLGIVALIIGLGAQSIVSDIIAGFFIVFEEEFKVGDIIVIDDFRGSVIDIGIRMTRIVDAGGNIKIVNNSDIKSVINQTSNISVPMIKIQFDNATKLEDIQRIIEANKDRFMEKVPDMLEANDFYQVERDLSAELFTVFNENNIAFPTLRVVLDESSSLKVNK